MIQLHSHRRQRLERANPQYTSVIRGRREVQNRTLGLILLLVHAINVLLNFVTIGQIYNQQYDTENERATMYSWVIASLYDALADCVACGANIAKKFKKKTDKKNEVALNPREILQVRNQQMATLLLRQLQLFGYILTAIFMQRFISNK